MLEPDPNHPCEKKRFSKTTTIRRMDRRSPAPPRPGSDQNQPRSAAKASDLPCRRAESCFTRGLERFPKPNTIPTLGTVGDGIWNS